MFKRGQGSEDRQEGFNKLAMVSLSKVILVFLSLSFLAGNRCTPKGVTGG